MAFVKASFENVHLVKEDGTPKAIRGAVRVFDDVLGDKVFRFAVTEQDLIDVLNATNKKAKLKAKVKEQVKPKYLEWSGAPTETVEAQAEPSDITTL